MRRSRRVRLHVAGLLALIVYGCAPGTTAAQGPQGPEPVYPSEMLQPLRWRNLGPAQGGRSIAVAGSDARPEEYYFGATGGGLWKTTDGGTTWQPVTDGQLGSSSVGAVGVCEADPDVVYIGTGESDLRGNVMPGDGVYRSTDGGKKWAHIGLAAARNIAKVRVDPKNCDDVWVAALGHYGDPNPERGVYRSTDGGKTWQHVLSVNDTTGAVELALDPSDANTAYAAMWQVWRKPWGMSSGGAGSGLYKTTDGGKTWDLLSDDPGMPAGPLGKIGVAVSPVDPQRVYAIVEAAEGGVFRSDDGGATWTKTNDERKLRQRAFYYTRIYADPQKKDVVYVLNTAFYKSTDAGKTFPKRFRVPHGDNHDLWIAPGDDRRMINGNDGGANVSVNGGDTWTDQDFSTAQIYHVSTTTDIPYHVCGAQQDNSAWCMPSDGRPNSQYRAAGGESGYIAPDPLNPDVTYGGSYGGLLERYDRKTGISTMVNPWPDNPMGYSAEDIAERFQWTYPIVFSPENPHVLYATSQHVWKTTNGGRSWERISPDLTLADPATLGPSGGPITKDQTGVETFATIFTLAPSLQDSLTLWTGSDDGLVHITRDGGAHWTDITPPALPRLSRISMIDASPHEVCRAYVAANRYLLGDQKPYAFKTDDCGKTWTDISSGMPVGAFTHAVREDPVRPGLLYAATEEGVYVSWDDGARWQSLSRNLPLTQVADLIVHGNDLVIATHGRGFWTMEDISPLRQLTPTVAKADAYLFQPDDPVLGVSGSLRIAYHLADPAKSLKLEVVAPDGKVIESWEGEPPADSAAKKPAAGGEEEEDWPRRGGGPSSPGMKTGMNTFQWSLRYPGPTTFPDIILWAGSVRSGPVAPPGEYSVRLTADGKTQTRTFRIRQDPRLPNVTDADLTEQFRFSMQIRDRVSAADDAVRLIRGVRKQVRARLDEQSDDAALQSAGKELLASLAEVEGEIYQVRNRSSQDPLNFPIKLNNKLAALMGVVQRAEGRPTAQSYEIFQQLSGELDQQLSRLHAILDRDLVAFNDQLRAEHLEVVRQTMIPETAPVGEREG